MAAVWDGRCSPSRAHALAAVGHQVIRALAASEAAEGFDRAEVERRAELQELLGTLGLAPGAEDPADLH